MRRAQHDALQGQLMPGVQKTLAHPNSSAKKSLHTPAGAALLPPWTGFIYREDSNGHFISPPDTDDTGEASTVGFSQGQAPARQAALFDSGAFFLLPSGQFSRHSRVWALPQ